MNTSAAAIMISTQATINANIADQHEQELKVAQSKLLIQMYDKHEQHTIAQMQDYAEAINTVYPKITHEQHTSLVFVYKIVIVIFFISWISSFVKMFKYDNYCFSESVFIGFLIGTISTVLICAVCLSLLFIIKGV